MEMVIMINPRNILYAGLPLAASLLLGGCLTPTSEKADSASEPQKTALAADISMGWVLEAGPGSATSIGAGADGVAYMTATDNQGNGSHTLLQWNGSGFSTVNGTGFEVDVGTNNEIWLIGSDHRVYASGNNGISWSGTSSPLVSEIGLNSFVGAPWALGLGTINSAGDHAVYKYNGSGWSLVPGRGGVRIDVDGLGDPYLVNANHDIYKWNSSNSSFQLFTTQKATDIAVNPGGSVWIISNTTVAPNGDKAIYGWDGSTWQLTNGGAKRISVAQDGVLWIVNSDGAVYKGNW